MGTKAREIVGQNADEIIELLNKALADEWLATYQYWAGSYVVKGLLRKEVQNELKEHMEEELKHVEMLAERIIQLGGTPILDPKQLGAKSNCGYDVPSNFDSESIVKQNIKGEQCAIISYQQILQKLKSTNDYVTFNIIRKILKDEIEHEQDLEDLLSDIQAIKKK